MNEHDEPPYHEVLSQRLGVDLRYAAVEPWARDFQAKLDDLAARLIAASPWYKRPYLRLRLWWIKR